MSKVYVGDNSELGANVTRLVWLNWGSGGCVVNEGTEIGVSVSSYVQSVSL